MAKEIIKKANNGTYYFRAHIGFDSKGKRIQKYKSGYKTKKEARESYYELQLQKPDLLKDETKDMKFDIYINSIFLPYYMNTVKSQTYDNRKSIIKKHFRYFDSYSVDKITALQVQKWVLKLSESLKPNYIRAVQGLFSLAMDRAVVLGLSNENPSKVIGNVKKQKTKIQFWTKEEFEKVISAINRDDYYQRFLYVSIWFLFMTGLRIGEATALYWNDIDFNTGVLKVNKSLIYKSQKDYRFGEPKTKASNRLIVLDNDTLNLLRDWKSKQYGINPSEPFILSYNGFPTRKQTISHALGRYSKMVNIHYISCHGLRHSNASLLISLSENILVIRDRLGHSDVKETLGTYGHLYENANFLVAKKLNGIINILDNSANSILTRNQFTSKLT